MKKTLKYNGAVESILIWDEKTKVLVAEFPPIAIEVTIEGCETLNEALQFAYPSTAK